MMEIIAAQTKYGHIKNESAGKTIKERYLKYIYKMCSGNNILVC